MAAKTVHVYPSGGAWAVRKDGQKVQTFDTKRQAVLVGVNHSRKGGSGQLVIHAKNGRVLDFRTYRLPKVQDPPKAGLLGFSKIKKAVGKVVRERLHAEPAVARDVTSKK